MRVVTGTVTTERTTEVTIDSSVPERFDIRCFRGPMEPELFALATFLRGVHLGDSRMSVSDDGKFSIVKRLKK